MDGRRCRFRYSRGISRFSKPNSRRRGIFLLSRLNGRGPDQQFGGAGRAALRGGGDVPGRLELLVRAFRHRNYRLFFGGQIVSLVGTFLTQVATIWLVYRLTGSPWLLGVVGFASQAPMFLLSPFAEDDKRGRVMSFFTMAFIGMTPWGNLIAGSLASRLGNDNLTGASRTLLIDGVICVAAALLFARKLPALRGIVHPIYVRKGIIREEVATGIESATGVVAGGES